MFSFKLERLRNSVTQSEYYITDNSGELTFLAEGIHTLQQIRQSLKNNYECKLVILTDIQLSFSSALIESQFTSIRV